MKRLRHLLEYLGLRVLLFLVDCAPPALSLRLADFGADLAYLLLFSRRRIAVSNLLATHIAADAPSARRLARLSFRCFARMAVESLCSDRYLEQHNWQDCIEWEASPELLQVLNDPQQGLILASGHLGSWEVAAHLLSYHKPVVGITRSMNNPYTERLISRRKSRGRFELTPKHDLNTARLVTALKQKKILAIMIDQHAYSRGVRIDFLGRSASYDKAVALLHLITKTPLCFGYCIATAPMRFKFIASDPISYAATGDKEADVRAILKLLNDHLETAVRTYPDKYLWSHRRWRPE
ncbi:MAG: hypothetical protein GX589_03595 [Deltaproteobacteria bacterium]|nr:hypothetical protein [Deltaproteobacteria bacterium]